MAAVHTTADNVGRGRMNLYWQSRLRGEAAQGS